MAALRILRRSQRSEAAAKLRLAEDTYNEVLDATKHQDDKIGRLMTGMAFLTAAALALANLGHAEFLTATFDVRPSLKLGLIAMGAFGVLVALAMILLLMALGTPLNLTREERADESVPKWTQLSCISSRSGDHRWTTG